MKFHVCRGAFFASVGLLVSCALLSGTLEARAAGPENHFQTLGGVSLERARLYFGGSFSPPTREHMGILTHLAARFGFTRASMRLATPYKKGAAPAEVSLELSRLAVGNADEVLESDSVPFDSFVGDADQGRAEWKGRGGLHFTLDVDDYEIRNGIRENALKSLKQLHKQEGDARDVYWISGADSFASVSTWTNGTPEWKELFDHANWLIISRPGFDSGPKGIQFQSENPLLPVLGEEFLSNYHHFFDATNQVHVYRNKNPEKPSIYLVDQPVLDDSSSKNRASLQTPGDHEHAQGGLQPSVFKRCLKKGYFVSEESEEVKSGTKVFTKNNLIYYVHHLFKKALARAHLGGQSIASMTMSDSEILEMTDALVEFSIQAVEERKLKSGAMVALSQFFEVIVEHVSELKQFVHLGEKMRELAKEYKLGSFALVAVAAELAEWVVIPPVMVALYGPKGLALAPFIHPNEMLVIPGFIAYNAYLVVRDRIRIAGSLEQYQALTDFRNRLLRSDPERTLLKVSVDRPLGLGGSALSVNLIDSQWPKWVPLFLRRLSNDRIRWYDLNVSTNEMLAVLGNPLLAKELKDTAGKNTALYNQLLFQAALSRDDSRIRLELFLLQRYFTRLHIAETPVELSQDATPSEQSFLNRMRSEGERFRNYLGSSRAEFTASVTFIYSALRMVELDPSLVKKDSFWSTALDLWITGYPGLKLDLKKRSHLKRLREQLPVIALTLASIAPQHFTDVTISSGGVSLIRMEGGKPEILFQALQSRSSSLALQTQTAAVRSYFERNHDALALPQSSLQSSSQSSGEREENQVTASNLLWEGRLTLAKVRRELEQAEESFERARLYLKERPRDQKAESLFLKAFDRASEKFDALAKDAQALELKWLKIRYPHQFDEGDETVIPEYLEIQKDYMAFHAQIADEIEKIKRLNQRMYGVLPADLQNLDRLRTQLGLPERMSLLQKSCKWLLASFRRNVI